MSKQDLEFAKAYAQAHGMTVTEFLRRYLRRLRALQDSELNGWAKPCPEVKALSGLVPEGIDVEAEYRQHVVTKHR